MLDKFLILADNSPTNSNCKAAGMGIQHKSQNETLTVTLAGDYLDYDNNGERRALLAALRRSQIRKITVEAAALGRWDSTLVVILYELARAAAEQNQQIDLTPLPENLRKLIALALEVDRKPQTKRGFRLPFLTALGKYGYGLYTSFRRGWSFIRQTLSSFRKMLAGKAVFRRVDFLFAMEDGSYRAVAIVSLVSFMVGLILAFVGAIQLKTFGAQIYVASLVGVAMTRIMGAIMVGIIMAGRTGASYAATIGTMQVNEEIDALKTMGIPTTDFLVLPRITSLIITMPFLTLLADFMGILGGAAVGIFMLDIAPPEYWKYTIEALSAENFLVGVFHGFVYGWVIAICGCYFGINSGRNADSVGKATTNAVVSAIVWMIVVTGFLTWLFEVIGI